MARSRRRCALRGRCSCSALDAAGRTACRRSQRCKHAQAPFRKLRRALRESIHRHWLRKPSRFPLRPRQFRTRSGAALAWRARRGLPPDSGSALARRLGRGGPSGKARADAAGLRICTRRSGAAGRGRSSNEPAADRSWCTVGPLVGFAFRPRQPTDLIRGSDGALTHTYMNARTRTQWHTRSQRHTRTRTNTHTNTHTQTHAHAHTPARTQTHAHTRKQTHARTHTHAHARYHDSITHTRTHAHSITHAHTHTHTLSKNTRTHTRQYHARTHARSHTHTQLHTIKVSVYPSVYRSVYPSTELWLCPSILPCNYSSVCPSFDLPPHLSSSDYIYLSIYSCIDSFHLCIHLLYSSIYLSGVATMRGCVATRCALPPRRAAMECYGTTRPRRRPRLRPTHWPSAPEYP
jgi:hypothetical protein